MSPVSLSLTWTILLVISSAWSERRRISANREAHYQMENLENKLHIYIFLQQNFTLKRNTFQFFIYFKNRLTSLKLLSEREVEIGGKIYSHFGRWQQQRGQHQSKGKLSPFAVLWRLYYLLNFTCKVPHSGICEYVSANQNFLSQFSLIFLHSLNSMLSPAYILSSIISFHSTLSCLVQV